MTQTNPPVVYNYDRTRVRHFNFDLFVGPAAGKKIIDKSLTDLETGEAVKLSDFAGKWVVIETASSTCSMYTKNILPMTDVVAEFPDVVFIVVYVREAHPGERMGGHKSMEEKTKAAKLVAPRYGEHRRVLVDDLEGNFHRTYGGMPNILYVVRPDGTVHYRSNWAAPTMIRDALLDRENLHTVENADGKTLRASRQKFHMIRTMWTGGFLALYDFFRNAPQTVIKHKMVDDYYKKHGRFKNQPDEAPNS
jgi:hypothetical protein